MHQKKNLVFLHLNVAELKKDIKTQTIFISRKKTGHMFVSPCLQCLLCFYLFDSFFSKFFFGRSLSPREPIRNVRSGSEKKNLKRVCHANINEIRQAISIASVDQWEVIFSLAIHFARRNIKAPWNKIAVP